MWLKREFPESLAPTAEPQRFGKAVLLLKVAFPSEARHEALRCTQSKPGSGAMSPHGTKPTFSGCLVHVRLPAINRRSGPNVGSPSHSRRLAKGCSPTRSNVVVGTAVRKMAVARMTRPLALSTSTA